jgi:RNA polymerase sigma factor (sigma-70 family)
MQIQEYIKRERPELSDALLMQQSLCGDEHAFETLVRRYSTPIFNFIYRFLGDYDKACDVLQYVFVQLYTSLPSLRTEKPLKTWLFQVARNRCLDELRRRDILHFSELESALNEDELSPVDAIPDSSPLPAELAERHDMQQVLQQAIDALPSRFRAVVLLRYTAQLSFSEIGQVLNMPDATAKTYFQRARPILRAAVASKLRITPSC